MAVGDAWVATRLRDWGLETYIPTFEENHITRDLFEKLDQKYIDRLISSVGHNLTFSEKLTELKHNVSPSNNQITTKTSSSDNRAGSDEAKKNNHGNDVCDEYDVLNAVLVDLEATPPPNAENVQLLNDGNETTAFQSDNSTLRDMLDKDEFMKLLESNVWGHLVIAKFNTHKTVDADYLCRAILPTLMINKQNYKLEKSDFEDILRKVKLYSGLENLSKLYSIKKNSASSTSGTLYYGYQTIRKALIKEGLVEETTRSKKTKAQTTEENTTVNAELQGDADLNYLLGNYGTLEALMPIYERSLAIRCLFMNGKSIQQILALKCLHSEDGHKYLVSDFDKTYPNEKDNFTNNWLDIAKAVIKLAAEEKSKTSQARKFHDNNIALIEDGKEALLGALLLPLVMANLTTKMAKDQTSSWRPTKVQVKDGFILHVKTEDDIQKHEDDKKLIYQKYGIKSVQPFIIIVGDLKNIQKCYIQVDSYRYTPSDPLEAINACYKVFFALNAKYPPECKHVWSFIQQKVFNMKDTDNLTSASNFIQTVEIEMNKAKETS